MVNSLEFGECEDAAIVVPADRKVRARVVLAYLKDPQKWAEATSGGHVSLLLALILVVFPMLETIFDKYFHEDRKKDISLEGQSVRAQWVTDEKDPVWTTELTTLCYRVFMTVMFRAIKPSSTNPDKQVGKRLSAALAASGRRSTDIVPLPTHIATEEGGRWLCANSYERLILIELFNTAPVQFGKLGNACIEQLRLIASFANMTPVTNMYTFCTSGLTAAIMLPGVGTEASLFMDVYTELQHLYGVQFPYMKVLSLEGHDRLNSSNFPNLSTVATQYLKETDSTMAGYAAKRSPLCKLSDATISAASKKPPLKRASCSQNDRSGIKRVCGVNDVDLDSATPTTVPAGNILEALKELLQGGGSMTY
ncbi:TPA_asm: nucleoprotein [little skate bornavirus]|uniref:Nucleoprotein n=1 Tax=little skate bornavirus TaxID=3055759 RepID=A0AA48SFL3_9MONO|nr:TPA_asm: nucleoprotein [little skate bornavirus]